MCCNFKISSLFIVIYPYWITLYYKRDEGCSYCMELNNVFFSEIGALLKPHYRNYVPIKQELKVLYVAYNRTIENKSHTKENGETFTLV